jgi:hypothetical protein
MPQKSVYNFAANLDEKNIRRIGLVIMEVRLTSEVAQQIDINGGIFRYGKVSADWDGRMPSKLVKPGIFFFLGGGGGGGGQSVGCSLSPH